MKKKKNKWLLPILTLFIGALFGSGGVWQYLEFKLEDKYRGLAAKNDDLRLKNETLSTDLERAEHTTEWRKNLEKDLISIINLTHDFEPLNLCSGNATREQRNTAIDLKQQLEFKKQNFERLEYEIANFEKREVRNINLQFSPPCPPVITGIKIIRN